MMGCDMEVEAVEPEQPNVPEGQTGWRVESRVDSLPWTLTVPVNGVPMDSWIHDDGNEVTQEGWGLFQFPLNGMELDFILVKQVHNNQVFWNLFSLDFPELIISGTATPLFGDLNGYP